MRTQYLVMQLMLQGEITHAGRLQMVPARCDVAFSHELMQVHQ